MQLKYIEFSGKHPKGYSDGKPEHPQRRYYAEPDPAWNSYGAKYPEGFLKLDIDDYDHKTDVLTDPIHGKPRSEAVVKMLEAAAVSFFGIRTQHGVHLFFRVPEGMNRKSVQNWVSAVGIVAEWKFPESDDHMRLKDKGKLLEVFGVSDLDEADVLPAFLLPVQKNRNKPFSMEFPEHDRTNALGGFLFYLVEQKGFTAEAAVQAVQNMNDYVFEQPIPERTLQAEILNDKTLKKLKELEADRKKKTVSIDVFRMFLKENGVSVRYNELLNVVEYGNLPASYDEVHDLQNNMPTKLLDEFERYTKKAAIRKQKVTDFISYIADVNSYNPVRDYLTGGAWDGKDRFPDIFAILGVTDPFQQTLVRKWFFQAAAMPFNDLNRPFQAEGVLILQGDEGIGKTRFFEMVTPEPLWFASLDKDLNTNNKDTLIRILSVWIAEIGEIDRTFRANRSDVKSFITARSDSIRKPYKPEPTTKARTTVYCGTTNADEFLTADSGERRWWVVQVKFIDHNRMKRFSSSENLKQFWYQCRAAWVSDPDCFRLNSGEQQMLQAMNQGFTEMIPAQQELMNWLNFDADPEQWQWMTATEVNGGGYGLSGFTAQQVGRALSAIHSFDARIQFRKRHGLSQYLIPPAKTAADFMNKSNVK